jgi:PAS domain S-box-containing protein
MSRSAFDSLRERAERLLEEKGRPESPMEFKELVQEFQVLQAELEVQAEELQRSHVQAERARRHYFELFEHSPAGIILLDPLAVVLDANRQATAMLERPLDQVRRASFTRFVDAADQGAFATLVKGVSGGTTAGEFHLRQAGGGRVTIRARMLLREDGTSLFSLEDVTPLRRAETEARDTAERYRALLDATSDGVVLIDETTRRVVDANRAVCALLGAARADLVGRAREELFPPEDRALAPVTLDRLARPGQLPSPARLRSAGGRDVRVELTVTPVAEGRALMLLVKPLAAPA